MHCQNISTTLIPTQRSLLRSLIYVMRKVWIGAIHRLSCAIYGSIICAMICGLRTQSMDCTVRKVWIKTIHGLFGASYPHGLYTYVPSANYALGCMHTQRWIHRLCTRRQAKPSKACMTRAWAGFRHAGKGYHSDIQAFATEY